MSAGLNEGNTNSEGIAVASDQRNKRERRTGLASRFQRVMVMLGRTEGRRGRGEKKVWICNPCVGYETFYPLPTLNQSRLFPKMDSKDIMKRSKFRNTT
jgi:hypothetical protein